MAIQQVEYTADTSGYYMTNTGTWSTESGTKYYHIFPLEIGKVYKIILPTSNPLTRWRNSLADSNIIGSANLTWVGGTDSPVNGATIYFIATQPYLISYGGTTGGIVDLDIDKIAGDEISADTDLYAKFTALPPKTYLKTSNTYVNKINGQKIKKIIIGSSQLPIAGVKEPLPSGGYDFANDSWATIFSQIKAGTDHYNLGDTKTDTFNFGGTSYQCTWKIVDDTVGRYVTQSGQSHKVIEMQELIGFSDSRNSIAWNSSGSATSFANSSLFADLNSTILGYLSADLKAQLETTTVYSGNGSVDASASTNVPATGKLFIPCLTELYGNTTYGYANSTEGTPQYTYYAQQGVSSSSYADLIKYNIKNITSVGWYWTRSPFRLSGLSARACFVGNDGSIHSDSVDRNSGKVALCFAI